MQIHNVLKRTRLAMGLAAAVATLMSTATVFAADASPMAKAVLIDDIVVVSVKRFPAASEIVVKATVSGGFGMITVKSSAQGAALIGFNLPEKFNGEVKLAASSGSTRAATSVMVAAAPFTTTPPTTRVPTTVEPPAVTTTIETLASLSPSTATTAGPGTANAPIVNRPAQAASIMWGGGEARARSYAHPGGLVSAGRDNYQDQAFKDVSAGGGTVLIYLDPIIDNDYGRYHQMLLNNSACGPAVPRWPGAPKANQWGNLNDFRKGGVLQQKLDCVLEAMVKENPHMGGWFADDIGSRSWYPDLDWNKWSSADKTAYREGAIALTQTFRKVADRHGLMFIVNGTWTANDGGGYPDVSRHGNALADGGVVEHHDGEVAFWKTYACSNQWASQSAVSKGKAFMFDVSSSAADRNAYAASGCFAYATNQITDNYDFGEAWGSFHSTGLPSKVRG